MNLHFVNSDQLCFVNTHKNSNYKIHKVWLQNKINIFMSLLISVSIFESFAKQWFRPQEKKNHTAWVTQMNYMLSKRDVWQVINIRSLYHKLYFLQHTIASSPANSIKTILTLLHYQTITFPLASASVKGIPKLEVSQTPSDNLNLQHNVIQKWPYGNKYGCKILHKPFLSLLI